jgi:hypothetical protein
MLRRAISVLPALLLSAGCSQGAGPSSGGTSESADDAGIGTGSGGGAARGSGGSTSSSGGSGGSTSSGGSGGSTSGGGSTSSGGSTSGGGSTSSGGSTSGDGGAASSGTATGADASGGGTSSCTKADAACKASNSGCNLGSYYLYDNQWNCGASSGNHCGPESAYGCSNSDGTVDFVVTSNQPKGNTAVLSYPAIQDNFDSKPLLSSFSTISATFAETSPHVGDYEVAWDCWFNDNANEFMVWVDNYNQVPAGTKVASKVSLGGRAYDVWWSPGSGSGGYVVFYANATVTSGTVDLLQLFNYAAAHGWLPANSKVTQLSFGVEVCSTGGQDATWTISDYAITAK